MKIISNKIAAIIFSFLISVFSVTAQVGFADLQGDVRDQNGALIVGARVTVETEAGKVFETVSDERGVFRFKRLAFGSYKLKISAKGFAENERQVTFSDETKDAGLVITLYPTIEETVAVDDDFAANALDADRAAGTMTLNGREIEALPDDPDQLKEQLQQLASSSGSAPGQATVTVDGFLSGKLPPKSAISSVRINPDLYSAEYDTPPYRGGRIEITTKPGSTGFQGAGFFNFNHKLLNARDPFAPVRSDTLVRRYGFQFGGPIVRKRSGFFIDFEKRDIDEPSTVNAFVLEGSLPTPFALNVDAPRRLLIGSARWDWQINPSTAFIARYDFNANKLDNINAGGFNLPERAANLRNTENSIRFTLTSIISPTKFNEMRVGFSRLSLTQKAISNATAINVTGAFNSGGAGLQLQERAENRLEIADNLSITAKKHNLKIGLQLYLKGINDLVATNTNGTFTFGGGLAPDLTTGATIFINGLEQYRRALLGLAGGTPTRFSITEGVPDVSLNQWLIAGFIQDDWRVRPDLSVSFGLRYESQSLPSDVFGLAPRIGVAYSPDKKRNWVFRARAGVFYERISETLAFENSRLDGTRQKQIIIDDPSFPNPFINGTPANTIPNIRRVDETLRPPASLQMRVEFERQLPKGWKINASHSWTKGWAQLRSRNINAPIITNGVNPQNAPRPFGIAQNIFQFESSGRLRGRVLYVGVNQNANKYFGLSFGYLNFDFETDADSAFTFPQYSYDLSNEWGRPFWQSRHSAFLSSNINLPFNFRANLFLNIASGAAYNITTGQDNNGDGIFNDRPDILQTGNQQTISTQFGLLDPTAIVGNLPRNLGTNQMTANLSLNLSRSFLLARKGENERRLTFNVRASNLLNRTNLMNVNGVLASPFFGRANTAGQARRIEFGVRFSF